MDWPHRRAAYSRVPPLHLPQGACTRLCVLAQAKRSTANARALGGFRVAEPLMQRTGRLPVRTGRAVDAPSPQTALQRRHLPMHRSLPRVSEISRRIYRKQISWFVVCNHQLSPHFTADLGRSRMQSAACFIVFKRLFLLALIRSSPESACFD